MNRRRRPRLGFALNDYKSRTATARPWCGRGKRSGVLRTAFTDPAKQRDVPDAVLRMTGLTGPLQARGAALAAQPAGSACRWRPVESGDGALRGAACVSRSGKKESPA
jgi:hypothetical protein